MESFKDFLVKKRIIDAGKAEKLFKESNGQSDQVLRRLDSDPEVTDQNLFKAFAATFRKKALCEILVEEGFITLDYAQQLVSEFGAIPANSAVLIEKRLISEEEYARPSL